MQISISIVIKPRNGLFSAAASSPVSGNVTVTSASLFVSVPVLHFIHAARGEEGFYTKINWKPRPGCSLLTSEGSYIFWPRATPSRSWVSGWDSWEPFYGIPGLRWGKRLIILLLCLEKKASGICIVYCYIDWWAGMWEGFAYLAIF